MNRFMKFNPHGLRFYFAIRLALVVLFVAAITIYTAVSYVSATTIESHMNLAQVLAEEIAANSEYGFLTGDKVILEKMLEGVKRQKDVAYAAIVEREGAGGILYDFSRAGGFRPQPLTALPAVVQKEQFSFGKYHMVVGVSCPVYATSSPNEAESLLFEGAGGSPPPEEKTLRGAARVFITLDSDLVEIGRLSVLIVSGVVAGLLLLVVMLYAMLSGQVLAPLDQFIQGVREVGKGNLDYRIPLRSKSEIKELVEAFNDSVERRQRALAELSLNYEQLEELVKERTKELNNANDALTASEVRYRIMAENANDLIGRHDTTGRYLYASPSSQPLLGYPNDGLLGMNFLDLVHQDDHQEAQRQFTEMLERNQSTVIQCRLKGKDGEYKWMEIAAKPVVNIDGKIVEIITVTRDISARKQVELDLLAARNQAENATRLKDKFVAAASHDLRSPIASLQVLVRYMQGRPEIKANPETNNVFAAAFKNTQGIIKLIDALLDLNRIQMGKLTYHFEECDAAGIVLAAIEPLQALAADKNITIRNFLRPGLAIKVDESLIIQAIQNLISNAIKYCVSGGEISITGGMTAQGFVLEVKDNGIGMPTEMRERLFTDNFLKSAPGTAGEQGSGLGLQFCSEIIKMHKGQITVESKVGEGTIFAICIPRPQSS